jgi:anti-sigma regulatory factor (Ser/Thr protein kinase)
MDGMTRPSTSIPYPAAVELRRWTLDSFRELRGLRAALREAVAATSGADPGDLFDRMAVVATELATNALRHGLPPTVVRLLAEHGRLIIDVADHDRAAAPRPAAGRPLGQGGLGLQVARSFAVEVGWYTTEDTKHVWASFPG